MLEHITDKELAEMWVVEIGSVMWGMNILSSDHDYFVTYIMPTWDLFTGRMTETLPQKSVDGITPDGLPADISAMEIGHLVQLLKKGNVNAIWATLSPVIVGRNILYVGEMEEIRRIVEKYRSRMTYYSVRGMAMSEIADAEKRAGVRDSNKSLKTALRTIEFGIRWLEKKPIRFVPPEVYTSVSKEVTMRALADLEAAYEVSDLPDEVPIRCFDRFLYKLRMDQATMEW